MDEISREKNKLETVLQHMNDGVLAFDTDRRLILINSEAKAMLGIKDDTNITFDSYFKSLGLTVTMSELLYLKSMVKQEIEFGGKYFNAFFATFKSDNTALSSGVVVVIQDLTDMQQLSFRAANLWRMFPTSCAPLLPLSKLMRKQWRKAPTTRTTSISWALSSTRLTE